MITGIFKEECKYRFLAKVIIDGKEEECYMPTSSKLSKIINLKNKYVYLLKNSGKNLRTMYKVHSVLIDKNQILLDLNCINNLFYKEILLENKEYLPEKTLNKNLKVDFFNIEQKEIIEIKGLISEGNFIKFPYLNTNRVIRQLKEMSKLNYKSKLVFILMNPKIKTIELDSNNIEFMRQFNNAIKNNISIEFYKIKWKNNEEHLQKVTFIRMDNIFIKSKTKQ